MIENQWVVPFDPFLLQSLKSHVNVEICSSIKAIKYVLKYIQKGSDQAIFELQQSERDKIQQNQPERDEIKNYQSVRYFGASQAAWRILQFPIQERHPTVLPLPVHLQNGQRVYFTEENAQNVANADPPSDIAVTLLNAGRTRHSTFKIPLSLRTSGGKTCNISKSTDLTRVIREAIVIIVDEAPMTSKLVFEALDTTFKDIRESELPFGGVRVKFCG